MKLKMVGDGTPQGTHIICSETGEMVENVEFVELSVHATEGVKGKLRFLFLQVDIEFSSPGISR